MPIFRDPDQRCNQDTRDTRPRRPQLHLQGRDEMRCPIQNQGRKEEEGQESEDVEMKDVSPPEDVLSRLFGSRMETSDRVELIERIKRGESPTWVPGAALEDYFSNNNDPPQSRLPKATRKEASPPLLPSAQLKENLKPPAAGSESIGAEIQRPRSALHSGDFREGSPHEEQGEGDDFQSQGISQSFQGPLGSSPTAPWYSPSIHSFRRLQNQFQADERFPSPNVEDRPPRSRAPSLGSSLSSSFILKPPTSPLVYQSNNTDLDFSPRVELMNLSTSPDKASRRRTLPADSFRSRPYPQHHTSPPRPSALRREGSYQAHQPRRSIASSWNHQYGSSPQTPTLRSRAPSFSSDISPLQHASMVGSYEESILRGRMSTTPSKPLDFMAQIGVLGKGQCRPSLKCPPHISVPFPAVFYSYPTTGGRRSSFSDDGPSPYVGLIDLESRAKSEKPESEGSQKHNGDSKGTDDQNDTPSRHRLRSERKIDPSKAPPGGSYRIPQKGQLQIIIKNPNKTAVKLFLVPYDLDGMEPGTKTFIRQRSYSAGPIIGMPLSNRTNAHGDKTPNGEKNLDKPVLRYLIHLHICSPSKGRFYLYQGIRVVFANRVPDDKEKLRNEIQLPEPRYSPYAPRKDPPMGAAGAKLAQDKAMRRRSSNFGIGPGRYDTMDGIITEGISNYPSPPPLPPMPQGAIPFQMSPPSRRHTPPSSRIHMAYDRPPLSTSPITGRQLPITPPQQPALAMSLNSPGLSSSHPSASSNRNEGYNKLSKGDAGYGGSAFGFTSTMGETGEGLLARRLKGLDVQKLENWSQRKQE